MAEPVRLVQVGMGGWGRDWSAVTAASPDVVPVAYVDPSPAALAATAATGVREDLLFGSLDAALAARPEAALVTAALAGHVPVALAALEAGLHVVVEKPFAPSLAEAAAVVRAAGALGQLLAVSQNYRHHPAALAATELVRSGRVGAITAVEVDFRRAGRATVESGIARGLRHPLLVDMAIHQFDLMRTVLGREPEWVECHAMLPAEPYGDPLAAYATVGFGDVLVSYRGNWVSNAAPTAWGGEWRLEGAAGTVEWTGRGDPGVADRVRVLRAGRPPEDLELPEVPALGRAGVLAAFAAAIRTGGSPASSGRENLRTLALTYAAVRSATERRRVEVAELLSELPEELR